MEESYMGLFGFLPEIRRETWGECRERQKRESAAIALAAAEERALFAAQPDAVKVRYAFARKCMALCLPFFIIAGALGWKIALIAAVSGLIIGLVLYRRLYPVHGVDAVLPLVIIVIGLGLGLFVAHPALAPLLKLAEQSEMFDQVLEQDETSKIEKEAYEQLAIDAISVPPDRE
jgi:hypothetical protein